MLKYLFFLYWKIRQLTQLNDASLMALVFHEGLFDYFDAFNFDSTPTNKKAYTEKLTSYLEEKKAISEQYKDRVYKATNSR